MIFSVVHLCFCGSGGLWLQICVLILFLCCSGCFCDAVNLILAYMVIYIMVNDYPSTLLLSMGPVIIQHMLLLYQPVVLLTIDFYISPLVLYIHE